MCGLVGNWCFEQKLQWLIMTYDRWCELGKEGGELSRRRVGHTILAASGQIKYARRSGREREQEGEEKTGKQSGGNALQGSVMQRERKHLRGEERETEQQGQALVM